LLGAQPDSAPIQVERLSKSYGRFEAVRGIDFVVRSGEVFGLLGPNGAGKTTTVEILEGLRARDGGSVTVLGFDPGVQSRQLKDRIGVSLQSTNLPEKIQVIEALRLFASFYSRSIDPDPLLERLQLTEKRHSYFGQLSGGQKQRLVLALSLVNDPQVLFLDEPTAGLDPQARQEIHKLVQELRQERRTVLLTTHYIEEAERLCDRVAIIDEGRLITMGTPREIQERTIGHSRIEICCDAPLPPGEFPAFPYAERASVSQDRRTLAVSSQHPAKTLVQLFKWIDEVGREVTDVSLKKPSLEDVFIELTGRSLRE
jgi:ABC-2 type transport system ATP-binding protein